MVNYIGGGKRNHLDNSPSKYGRDGNPFRKDFIKMVHIVHMFNGLRRCMFPYIGNFIIPTGFHIFQRGRLKPPTSYKSPFIIPIKSLYKSLIFFCGVETTNQCIPAIGIGISEFHGGLWFSCQWRMMPGFFDWSALDGRGENRLRKPWWFYLSSLASCRFLHQKF